MVGAVDRLTLLLLGAALWLTQGASAQVLRSDQLDEVSRSIVKVYAQHPGKGEVAATGFAYGDSRSIVTSLHVIAGANRIQIKLSNGGALVRAEVRRSLRDMDLALLSLPADSSVPPLRATGSPTQRGDEVLAVGFPFNIPSVDDTPLRVKGSARRLREIIPDAVKKELDALGYPSTSARVLNVDGHLLPGHSGAPIFNASGELVAISNGGLAVGAASRSWAIEVRHLAQLLTSPESLPSVSVASSALFAEERASTDRSEILESEESGIRLRFVREATFEEMFLTSDDPIGLSQLVASFYPIDPRFASYRIYRELQGGASLVVPSGFDEPEWRDGMWRSTGPEGDNDLYFRLDKSGFRNLRQDSLQFERDLVAEDNQLAWQLDPNWTYPFPRPTLQGMAVRRLAYFKLEGWPMAQTKQMILTFSSANGVLLSAAAKLNDQQAIFIYPQVRKMWFTAASAAFLTTIGN